jgi:hypothetical protein
MENGKHQEVNLILKQFKDEYGLVKFENVLKIPRDQRIPALANKDFMRINMLIIGALTMAFKSLNLKNGLNEFQILDLSEAIIDSSHEDNLAFEDLMLFLQKLTRGEYEIGAETMNLPKFMKLFEQYRQTRYEELRRIRDERHTQYKVCGDTGKSAAPDPLSEHFAGLGAKLSTMKRAIQNLKEENSSLKMDKL